MPDAVTERIDGWEARRDRLRRRRKKIGSTQGQVAERAGLTQSYVGRVESGFLHATSYDVRVKLAKGLMMTPEALTRLLEPKKAGT